MTKTKAAERLERLRRDIESEAHEVRSEAGIHPSVAERWARELRRVIRELEKTSKRAC